MNISVIGAGYVGLTTAVAFASKGHSVVCIDIDEAKVSLINQGKAPIWEEGLEEMIFNCVKSKGRLEASSDYQRILDTDITLLCVGTPSHPDGSVDLSHVRESAKGIGEILSGKTDYHVIVVRSTVIPGTTRDVVIPLLEKYSGRKVGTTFSVVVNPEFMQEGKALHTFLNPDRIIIGQYEQKAGDLVEELYEGISAPIVRTDITVAEMIKYSTEYHKSLTDKCQHTAKRLTSICQAKSSLLA